MSSAVPYAPDFITSLLRQMSPAELATVKADDFQRWPVQIVTPAKIIRELTSNERARRKS
ncbi:hypothetical protein LZK98_11795 [Sphingomonas cannabina]|uniref:hypothetical protein n=1 Tax=Sphingomonas cannabina TaxID=2899123 RepID=UPI001F1D2B26|nr:hypothetical protein [Sphingomonas cannabina]UIJ43774.1 hypothetical protein LZK98_11795 [Sphingomonas cannabina]